MLQLLTAPDTAYVLVASPRQDTVEEASFFAGKLAENDVRIAALVVNRMHPTFGAGSAAAAAGAAEQYAGTPLGDLWANLADFRQVADASTPRWAVWPSRSRRHRWSRCRSCAPTSTTSTAWPTSAPTSSPSAN